MATTTETIYHHTCDLCGAEKDEPELASVFSGLQMNGVAGVHINSRSKQADICTACRSRPVSDLLAFFESGNGGTR